MMHVLVDVNIIVDALCHREPFDIAAKALLAKVAAGELRASLAATSFTISHYVARKQLGGDEAMASVVDLLELVDVLGVDRDVLAAAVGRAWADFEDALQDAAAELAVISTIVTRDHDGFSGSTRRIVDAATLVAEMARETESG